MFAMDPENSHDRVLSALATASRRPALTSTLRMLYGRRVASLPIQLLGLEFPNPVGLAAGLDKQGNAGTALAALGFGWVELGTVTPMPQPGNPRPRMFRLTRHQAIINRMGFNSIGLDAFLANVRNLAPGVIHGINIGKNAATPVERATDDYLACLEAVYPNADYITINISSPNTRDLRSLQEDRALDDLLDAVCRRALGLAAASGKRVPLVLKVAPDLEADQVRAIAALVSRHGIDGVAATNTTVSRKGVESHELAHEAGGLSGPPVREASTRVIAALHAELGDSVPIIGIGGIDSAASALEKLSAGASLLQLYTGLIYHGPGLVGSVINGLDGACRRAGYAGDYAGWLRDLHGTPAGGS